MMGSIRNGLFLVVAALCCLSAGASTTVPGSSNPKLAGMPNGTTAGVSDVAPAQSPVLFTELTFAPSQWLQFAATGSVDHCGGGCPGATTDGAELWTNGAENGISGITAPIDSLLGVFLGPNQPDAVPAPAALDFSPGGIGIEFTSLQPALQQVFFIGDGSTLGLQPQNFLVPAGATRLYLATHDGFGWFNNTGSFTVTLVPEPQAWMLLALGLGMVLRRIQRRA